MIVGKMKIVILILITLFYEVLGREEVNGVYKCIINE